MQWHRGLYTIDTSRERIDMDTVIRWLNGTYWAGSRSPEAIQRSWNASAVVFGLYAGDEMIGCARAVTDFVTVAYLADVFLLPDHRGQGLGLWLVETIVGHSELAGVHWLLHTKDAQGLYRRVGFTTDLGPRLMQRPRPQGS